ncbi:hypothetical protein GCM10009853_070190 [Glycomyces scopariae]
MRPIRLPRLHVITDTRAAGASRPEQDPAAVLAAKPSPGPDAGARARAAEPNPAAGDRGPAPAAARTSSAPVAPRAVAPQHELLLTLEAALAAGAGLIQIRPEDHYTDRAAFDLAVAVAELCDAYGAVCLVNDRVHIAQAIGADGVHLGADDLPIDAARRLLPDGAVIGGTCRDPNRRAPHAAPGPRTSASDRSGAPRPRPACRSRSASTDSPPCAPPSTSP